MLQLFFTYAYTVLHCLPLNAEHCNHFGIDFMKFFCGILFNIKHYVSTALPSRFFLYSLLIEQKFSYVQHYSSLPLAGNVNDQFIYSSEKMTKFRQKSNWLEINLTATEN